MKARIEQKFPFKYEEYFKLLTWIKANNGNYLFPPRIVVSRYFDNRKYQSYRDTLEGIIPRKKIRIRSYGSRDFLGSKDKYYLEKKITTYQNKYKIIKPLMSEESLRKKIDFGIYDEIYGMCMPVCDISYIREYYFLKEVRITIDKQILFSKSDNNSGIEIHNEHQTNFNNVIEIKSNLLNSFDSLLNLFPFPRAKFSKYELAIENLKKI